MIDNIDQFMNIERGTSELLGVLKYGKAWGRKEFYIDKWKYSICTVIKKNYWLHNYIKLQNNIHSHRLAMNASFDSEKFLLLSVCIVTILKQEK